MKYIHYISLFIIGSFFTSCSNISANMSWTGLIILGIVLMGLFIFMFYLIIKRRQKGQKSLSQFSMSIQQMLDKFDHPENKIGALRALINRIKEDKQYQKDTVWRDQVLAKAYLHLATEYHHIGDFKNTLNICSKILELTPDDAMTLYNRGSMYLNNGEYEKALVDLNKSIELVDNYGSSYNNRGTIFNKLERYEEALSDFEKALTLEESSVIYYNQGNTLKDLQRNEEAIAAYQKAMALCNEDDLNLKKEITLIIESLSTEK